WPATPAWRLSPRLACPTNPRRMTQRRLPRASGSVLMVRVASLLELKNGGQELLDRPFRGFSRRGVITDMRVKLDTRVVVSERLARRCVDQGAFRLLANRAMSPRLPAFDFRRRFRAKWIIKCMRRGRV